LPEPGIKKCCKKSKTEAAQEYTAEVLRRNKDAMCSKAGD
jgi:hypothetical protein